MLRYEVMGGVKQSGNGPEWELGLQEYLEIKCLVGFAAHAV